MYGVFVITAIKSWNLSLPRQYGQQQQSLLVLTLTQKQITAMKILKVKIRVLAAWNNREG